MFIHHVDTEGAAVNKTDKSFRGHGKQTVNKSAISVTQRSKTRRWNGELPDDYLNCVVREGFIDKVMFKMGR